ncbi:MAG: cbb3-type cytochrome c oxidase subunit I [Planctomycetota bacterium]|nr:cbb3-type cytochrome c oxidase subunit I [Planctomycetota bacterium]
MTVEQALAAPSSTPTPNGQPLVDKNLIKAWLCFTLFWTIVGPVLGLVASAKLDDPYYLADIEWLQFGRLRIAHVNGVIFGLFSTAIFAMMTYAVPKLCGRPLANIRAAWGGMILINGSVLLGEVTLLGGYVSAVEAGEYGLIIDILLTIGFVTAIVPFLQTIVARRVNRMYVALWYWTAGMLWTAINFVLGNYVLPYGPGGSTSAALHGFYLHNVVGLWITPMGLGAVYYMLPVVTRAPIYSHKLSLLGFWALALFYPLNGVHHYIYSPIADWAQTIAIAASMMLIVPVWAFSVNVWGTMQGQWAKFTSGSNYTLKFLILGGVWYLITCFQGPFEALRGMQRLTHFGEFNVGHAHSAVFGAFSIWAMACVYFIVPKVFGRQIWSAKLAAWHYWLEIIGFAIMFGALTIAGFQQGTQLLTNDVSWVESMNGIKDFWVTRTLGGTMMDVGLAFFVFNIVMSFICGKPAEEGPTGADAELVRSEGAKAEATEASVKE